MTTMDQVHQMPVEELRQAAAAGNPRAQYWLGRRLLAGKLVPQNCEEAHRWFDAAAAQGDSEAQSAEASCHIHGHGVPVDRHEAVVRLGKSAARNQPKAFWNLSVLARSGGNDAARHRELELLLAAARLGDACAMVRAAERMSANAPAAAREWYRRAALLGHPVACHQHSVNLGHDTREGRRWLRKAAKKGLAVALYELGCWELSHAQGDRTRLCRGLDKVRRAAEQKHRPAAACMTTFRLLGIGAEPSLEAAIAWARLAATRQACKPLIEVAEACYRGVIVPRDLPLALELLADLPEAALINQYPAINLRSLCLSDLGIQPDEAAVLGEYLMEFGPLVPGYLDTWAWALIWLDRLDEADQLLTTALATSNGRDRGDLLLHQAVLRWKTGRRPEARRLLAEALRTPGITYTQHEIPAILRRAGWNTKLEVTK